jgi:polysaccharide export outer membrane protein
VNKYYIFLGLLTSFLLLPGCATKNTYPELPHASWDARFSTKYKIGPGDSVNIFVWRNPDVSMSVSVRPDGYISAPLMEDVPAAGKTPTELAREVELVLSTYLRDPMVTVIVNGFVGIYTEQIRIIGEAESPQAMLYNDGMTMLDVMIQVGGLTDFAAGNNTTLIRWEEGVQKEYRVRLDDLIKDGDITANVDIKPGDILIIPEAWF